MRFRKTGFTLVEIMVVIVIMGILAAVAVPKLFGSVAKAKASEIAPAAATYQKLLDVYVMEKGAVGSWKSIGYVAPGNGQTNNFTYCGGEITEDIAIDSFGEVAKVGWQASNNASLNECSAGHWWFVSVKPESAGQISYTSETNAAECIALAKPNWTVANRTGVECGVAGTSQESASKEPVNLATNAGFQPGTWRADDNIKDYGLINQYKNNIVNTRGTWNNAEDAENGLYKLEPGQTYTLTIPFDENADLSQINSHLIVFSTSNPQSGTDVASGGSGWYTSSGQTSNNRENDAPFQCKYPHCKGDNTITSASYDYEKKTITMTISTGSKYESYYIAANLKNTSDPKDKQTNATQVASMETALSSVKLEKQESKEEENN